MNAGQILAAVQVCCGMAYRRRLHRRHPLDRLCVVVPCADEQVGSQSAEIYDLVMAGKRAYAEKHGGNGELQVRTAWNQPRPVLECSNQQKTDNKEELAFLCPGTAGWHEEDASCRKKQAPVVWL